MNGNIRRQFQWKDMLRFIPIACFIAISGSGILDAMAQEETPNIPPPRPSDPPPTERSPTPGRRSGVPRPDMLPGRGPSPSPSPSPSEGPIAPMPSPSPSEVPSPSPSPSSPQIPPMAPGAASGTHVSATVSKSESQQDSSKLDLPGEKEFNECIKIPAGRKVKITLKPESDIKDLVGWISAMTCKKFIMANNVQAQKITIYAPTPVTAQEAYRAFLSAIDSMGLTIVPSGDFLRIVQGVQGIQGTIPTYLENEGDKIPANDAVVTHLIRVGYTDANDLLAVLQKMKSRSGDVMVYRPTNTIILTDTASNVKRLTNIIKELDIPSTGEKIWVVRMKNADVNEVQRIVSSLFAQKTQPRVTRPQPGPSESPDSIDVSDFSASKMVADPATNSLIIIATPASFTKLVSLIRKLDVATEDSGKKNIHVYYLENGDAEAMASTLSSLTTGVSAARRGSGPGGPPQQAAALFEGDVKISADKATNSLVIIASTRDFLNLRRVMAKLDIPRRQVYVEAMVLEVNLSKKRDLGVTYHGGIPVGGSDGATMLGGVFPNENLNSLLLNPLALQGLALGARGAPIAGSGRLLGVGQDIPAFGVLIKALQTSSDVNVLSTPHILTTDNEEAEISIGENVPFQGAFAGALGSLAGAAGQQAGASALGSLLPTVSVQRQDVSLTMKLTPHVNDSDMVRLELSQEVSAIAETNFNSLGPRTTKRTAKTTVVVRDQQPVVIGGLMRDQIKEEEQKVPLLGDIPILGYLFKNKSKTVEKTNLLIILTPYVIRDQSDLRRIFEKKMEERQEFIEKYTAFKKHKVGRDIDYRYKLGLLAEINRVGEIIEEEEKLLKEARHATQHDVDPLEVPEGMKPASEGGSGGDGSPSIPQPVSPSDSVPPPPGPGPSPTPRIE